jgi:hypothetical protein
MSRITLSYRVYAIEVDDLGEIMSPSICIVEDGECQWPHDQIEPEDLVRAAMVDFFDDEITWHDAFGDEAAAEVMVEVTTGPANCIGRWTVDIYRTVEAKASRV